VTLLLEPAARTDVGRRRNNEDAVFATHRLAAIADGVGGAVGGEVASQAMIGVLMHLEKCRLEGTLEEDLAAAIAWGNERIGFIAACRPELTGMSTTLTVVALDDDGAYAIANVGDSRTYLLRDGALARLTRDDSFVQALIDRGALTDAEARRHPQRSLVLDALDGTPREPGPVARVAARPGDRLLLCSDGLSDALEDDAIAALLGAEADGGRCAEALVDHALAAGARDNVTVVVADVVARADAAPNWPRMR
jgi:protein phosphatase